MEYKIKKYHSTTIGNQQIKVFAGDTVIVEWKYPAPGVQEIVSIKLKQASNNHIQMIESTAFSTATLQKWLLRVAQAGKFTNRIPKLL